MSKQYFNNLRVSLCRDLLVIENNHQSMQNANIDCQFPLSNLCRCKVKRRAFVLVHTPHVGLALQMGKIVIDLHWLYIYDVRLQAIFRNLLSRQDPLKQLCVVCARRYLRDSNNDSEIKLSQVEFTMPWILLVMFIVHVDCKHLEFSLCYRGLQSIPVVRNILVVSAGTFVKQASLS